jgi:hypothetical protein
MRAGRARIPERSESIRQRLGVKPLLIAVVLTGALVGCGPEALAPSSLATTGEPARCVAEVSGEGTEEPRALAVGTGSAPSFHAYEEGEVVDLIKGYQGGYMITPSMRVDAAGDMRDEACFQVRIENALEEGGDVVPGLKSYVLFERSGEAFYIESLYDLLAMDAEILREKTLLLKATVRGDGFLGESEARIHLQ